MIRRHAARYLCAAGLALTLLRPAVSRADDDATVEMARQRFREGVQFYDQRQFEKARLAFLQAYAIKPHPSILLNLAQSELRAGKPEDAANHFSEYLRTNAQASDAEKQEAEVGFAAAKSKVGEVTISVDTPGAQVTVDGQDKGVAPLAGPIYVEPGAHTIEAKANDRHATKNVTVGAGQSANVNLGMKTAGAAAATQEVAAERAAPAEKEETEDEGAAEEEEKPAEAAPAAPSAEVSTGGRKNFFKWFGETPAAWVGGILGIGGVGAGVGFGLAAKQRYDNANSLRDQLINERDQNIQSQILPATEEGTDPPTKPAPCSLTNSDIAYMSRPPPGGLGPKGAVTLLGQYADACKKWQDNKHTGDQYRTVAIVSGIVGGAAIAGTIVYYFLDPNAVESAAGERSTFRARIVPVTGPSMSGLTVSGVF
jgi:tetratricopeptide (TPR) repeat protein